MLLINDVHVRSIAATYTSIGAWRFGFACSTHRIKNKESGLVGLQNMLRAHRWHEVSFISWAIERGASLHLIVRLRCR